MSDIHTKTLAAYKDLGSIYSYGYGAMRQALQTYHDGLASFVEFVKQQEEIVSAVEFRAAEIVADAMIETERLEEKIRRHAFKPAPQEPSGIFDVPQTADGIARDQ
jgi:hypothetical protein